MHFLEVSQRCTCFLLPNWRWIIYNSGGHVTAQVMGSHCASSTSYSNLTATIDSLTWLWLQLMLIRQAGVFTKQTWQLNEYIDSSCSISGKMQIKSNVCGVFLPFMDVNVSEHTDQGSLTSKVSSTLLGYQGAHGFISRMSSVRRF